MKLKKLYRAVSAEFVRAAEGEKAEASDTLEFPFSSEAPVERWFGEEVLSHEKDAADLSRLNDGANLLWGHDADQVIGVLEKAFLKESRLFSKIRWGTSARAQEVRKDVEAGIIRNVSFGYRIKEMKLQNPGVKGEEPKYLATKWMPFEVSFVSIPADQTVGVGRSDSETESEVQITNVSKEGEKKMPPENENPQPIVVDTAAVRAKAMEDERARILSIDALGERFKLQELARQLKEGGKSIEEARAAFLEKIGTAQKPVAVGDGTIGMSEKEQKSFSFLRALHALANPHDRHAQEAAGFEREASLAAEKATGRTSRGIMVPYDVLRGQKRDLTVGSSTAGGNLVGTEHLAQSFIEILRNKSVMARAGVTMLNGLVGNIAIPRQTGAATVYHVGENSAPTEGAITFDQVTMSPKTIAGYIDYSRRLLIQSSPDIDNLVKADLASGIALGIDSKALYGSGASNQPTGLQNISGLNLVEFTANAPTWAEIVDLETQIAADNADVGSMKYIINALGRGVLKTTEKASSTAQFIMESGTINGYPAEVSNQVSRVSTGKEHYWFGVWNQLMIGFWSGLDLLVDPYTGSKEGTVRVVAMQDYDVGCRHPEAFSLGYNS